MIIDDKTYKLSSKNYIPIETEKTQIILGHTFNNNMKHIIGWKNRYNGSYKKTAAYTISKDGTIYNHFDPKFSSNYFNNTNLNSKSIVILLENDGWLLKDIEKNVFITWIGDIYKEQNEVVEKRWRGLNFWDPYTENQYNSVAKLVESLCDEFNIPLTVIGHNTKIDKIIDYKGVMYKSNLEKHYTDLSASWDCEHFKNKLEQKTKI